MSAAARETYTQTERVSIVLEIVHRLRNYKDASGAVVDHYDGRFSFADEFRRVCSEYIRQADGPDVREMAGTIDYYEANRTVEYRLPAYRGDRPLFVFRVRPLPPRTVSYYTF
jgi:hypothetical protein